MQTALHIQGIVNEAKRVLLDAELIDTAFYRKERAAWLFFKSQKKKYALGLMFHPQGHGCVIVPAGKARVETNEKPFPFFQASYGARVANVEQLAFDRVIRVTLNGDYDGSIIVEALGPSANLWLLDSSEGRQQVLRNREFAAGKQYELPGAGTRLAPSHLDSERLGRALESSEKTFLTDALSKSISGIDMTLAKEVLIRAGIPPETRVVEAETGVRERLCKSIESLVSLAQNPDSGYLYSDTKPPSAQPFKLKSVDAQPEKYQSLSLAQLALAQAKKMRGEVERDEKKITQILSTAIKRQKKTIEKISSDLADAENFERYREYADLLKANLSLLKRGIDSIELENLYGSGTVTISLDAKLDGVENANKYYRKFQKGREGLETLQRRLEISRGELKRLQSLENAFTEEPSTANDRYADEIAALVKSREQSTGAAPAPRLPYRTYQTSTGLRVFVGRDGTDNDDTTFKHIKPYELWFHAAQCPGSHVGLKFPNKDFAPSKKEIEEAASLAAWFSKARKSATVPVNYTERKYVRKPRKAKPGLVTIERERTVMVIPTPPETREHIES